VIKDITIFFVYNTFTYSAEQGSGEGTSEMWRIQADGSGQQFLLRGDSLENNWIAHFGRPTLSHDGQRLVFVENIKLLLTTVWSTSLWTMDVDGSDGEVWVGQLLSDARPGSATWTDQDEIAFNTKPRPVSPVWSPDDSQIAFVERTDEDFGLVCVLDVASGQWRQISGGDVVAWSPDGQTLVTRSNHIIADTHNLRVINLDGQVETVIELSPDIWLLELDWSQSTGLVGALASRWHDGIYDLYVIDPHSGHTEVVVEDVSEYTPQWSPDGKMISFAHKNGEGRDLYVVDFNSREARLLMSQVGYSGVWSPDSRFILTQSNVEGNGLYIVSVEDGLYWRVPNIGNDSQEQSSYSFDWLYPMQ
jgi:Tol biopolymer transport system component